MFKITHNKGFQITFENGYTVSVQFGPSDYCDHYDREIGRDEENCGKEGSYTVECAVWSKSGEMINYNGWNYGIGPYMTPKQVLELLNWAESQ